MYPSIHPSIQPLSTHPSPIQRYINHLHLLLHPSIHPSVLHPFNHLFLYPYPCNQSFNRTGKKAKHL
jgi:hypothetical protein